MSVVANRTTLLLPVPTDCTASTTTPRRLGLLKRPGLVSWHGRRFINPGVNGGALSDYVPHRGEEQQEETHAYYIVNAHHVPPLPATAGVRGILPACVRGAFPLRGGALLRLGLPPRFRLGPRAPLGFINLLTFLENLGLPRGFRRGRRPRPRRGLRLNLAPRLR